MAQLRSMTAYGRGEVVFAYGRFTAEVQGVNRRYLEIDVRLPRLLSRFEVAVRKVVDSNVGRGRVQVVLNWKPDADKPLTASPNLAMAKGLYRGWEEIAETLGIEKRIDLSLLASSSQDLLSFEEDVGEEEVFLEAIRSCLEKALSAYRRIQEDEGGRLLADLEERVNNLQKGIGNIEKQAPVAIEGMRIKLSKRVEELFSGGLEQEERLLREVALYAEKADITEEIVRFRSHCAQFAEQLKKPLTSPCDTKGKLLDFLLQELGREANTIGAKAGDLAISQEVISLKGELEKIREQVQNIE
ncbi:MAG: hypothetical protein K940chlam9_00898 [Chlamydiae bacterium]|nr:hypothetical protein [Chlamydiota bacterium]